MDPFDSFVVFSIKHGMGNVNDLHELQTRSVFRGRTASLAPTADAWRLFAPTADAWRLFAPTAFPTKASCKEFAFRSIWEALQKQGKNLHKGNHRSPATCGK